MENITKVETVANQEIWATISSHPNFNRYVIGLVLTGGLSITAYKLYSNYAKKLKSNQKNLVKEYVVEDPDSTKEKKRIAVDTVFLGRLYKILRICVPGVSTKEFEYVLILSMLLLGRTLLTVEIAEMLGRNAQHLVARDYHALGWGVAKFAAVTIPASAINSGLKYFTNMLALRIRVRLSKYVNDQYLTGTNFYKAVNLGGEDRIENADQRVTADIEKFSAAIADLYGTIFKPVLDVILFTIKLTDVTGWQGISIMYGYFLFSGLLKRLVMPSFGKLIAKESELEGWYRTAHQRLITNSEEIAFYDGSAKEKTIITKALQAIFEHVSYFRYLKSLSDVFDGLLVKYWASIAGYGVLSAPLIWNIGGAQEKTAEILTREYIRNSQYLNKLSSAVGDLVLISNKITTIAGYTSRVSELLEQVSKLNTVGNKPFEVRLEKPIIREDFKQVEKSVHEWLKYWKVRCNERPVSNHEFNPVQVVGGGRYIESDIIQFENVDIISPEGKCLAKDLNFSVNANEHVMITGPNGAGKSSIFRVIQELWPLHCGTLKKPKKEDVVFIPQKPYLVLGTLRDQIIYPHSRDEMQKRGVSDDDLEHLLEVVDPAKLITKTWTWDTEKDWFHAFSGGQKQRVAMARLFYHRPKYAILDECTSAVSDEVEDKIYETCSELGITIFTVSHRKALARHHKWILHLDGRGGYSFSKIENKHESIIEVN